MTISYIYLKTRRNTSHGRLSIVSSVFGGVPLSFYDIKVNVRRNDNDNPKVISIRGQKRGEGVSRPSVPFVTFLRLSLFESLHGSLFGTVFCVLVISTIIPSNFVLFCYCSHFLYA